MIVSDHKKRLELRNNTTNSHNFVGSKLPFVGYTYRLRLPSICLKLPLGLNSGFTAVELVVTVVIVSVLLAIATPTLQTTIRNNRISTSTNDLISDINYARTEALRRARPVGLCMSGSGTACDGGTWQGGRIVFVDVNSDLAFTVGTDEVLRTRQSLANNTLTSASVPNPMMFNNRGRPLTVLGQLQTATNFYSLCDSRGPSYGRMIQIAPSGQASSSPTPPGC